MGGKVEELRRKGFVVKMSFERGLALHRLLFFQRLNDDDAYFLYVSVKKLSLSVVPLLTDDFGLMLNRCLLNEIFSMLCH